MKPTPSCFKRSILVFALTLGAVSVAWGQPRPANPPPRNPPPGAPAAAPAAPAPANPRGLGQPLSGLTTAQLAAFNAGRQDFVTRESAQTGLGPIFNDVSCAACHGGPSLGGSSPRTVTRFGRTENGVFDPLTALDGTLLHARAIAPALLETVPSQANVTAKRLTTPLYGAGLIDAIPDATILANAALPKSAGIKGRPAMVIDLATGETRIGRFGWKAQRATVLDFAADALNNEIGITNRLFPKAAAPDGNETLLARFVSPAAPIEDQPDATTGRSEIDRLADYMRFLAPPAPAPATAASTAGQKVFASIGCASCHTPSLKTGANVVVALSNKDVPLYSDLLLHDMGSLGDGIAQGDAGSTEMRTAPLWGLGARRTYLHDGRAATLAAAILAHAGEAANARDAYAHLSATDQNNLIAFLSRL